MAYVCGQIDTWHIQIPVKFYLSTKASLLLNITAVSFLLQFILWVIRTFSLRMDFTGCVHIPSFPGISLVFFPIASFSLSCCFFTSLSWWKLVPNYHPGKSPQSNELNFRLKVHVKEALGSCDSAGCISYLFNRKCAVCAVFETYLAEMKKEEYCVVTTGLFYSGLAKRIHSRTKKKEILFLCPALVLKRNLY